MNTDRRLYFLDNLRTFLIFLVVVLHAGITYESSGLTASFWIVDDPSTSDLTGLVNVVLDLFIMPTIFFISGYFTPGSLKRKGGRRFLTGKFRRLMVPWAIAVLTLMPFYKVIFLYSRGLPQEHWTTYFHFSNGILGMSWLWFLPVLFLFDGLYVLLRKLNLPTGWVTPRVAVLGIFLIGFGSSVAMSILGWLGWTKTVLVDFQNERLLIYFLVFLLGSMCYRHRVFETKTWNRAFFVVTCTVAWVPVHLYVVVLLNYLLRPGVPLISEDADGLLFWGSFNLSMLVLLYLAVTTFRGYFDRPGRLGGAQNELSYGVYVIHVAVMGPIALVLLRTDLPGLVKYPILVVATWVGSNLLVYGYRKAMKYRTTTTRALPA